MKIKILSILLISTFLTVYTQSFPGKYWVKLTDKNNNEYNISQPEYFLSQKSINRRVKYNIPIDTSDLPVSKMYIDSLENLGCKVLLQSKWLNAVTIATIDTALLDTIENISFIKYIDRFNTTKKNNITTKKNGINSISNYYDYGSASPQINIHNGEVLHNNNFRGQGMLITILDAGFTNTNQIIAFSHLYSENKIIATRNIVNANNNVYGFHVHGTMVLSTMAAYVPGEFIGTAPEASFILVRTEDLSSEYKIEEDYWISGAEFADSLGTDIITSSVGYNKYNDSRQSYTYSDLNGKTARISKVATIAARKGIAVINSAGNDGTHSWRYIGVPADADSILTIGAVSTSGQIASFSSKGPTSDGRIKPNLVAVGNPAKVITSTGDVTSSSGTSFATPITAGLVACLWQAKPELNNMELFNIIYKSSSKYLNPDTAYGYGIPDYSNALLYVEQLNGFSNTDKFIFMSENPIKTDIKFKLFSSQNQKISVTLYDMLGRTIYSKTKKVYKLSENNFVINDINNLKSRVLILRVITENKTFEMKLINVSSI